MSAGEQLNVMLSKEESCSTQLLVSRGRSRKAMGIVVLRVTDTSKRWETPSKCLEIRCIPTSLSVECTLAGPNTKDSKKYNQFIGCEYCHLIIVLP